MQSITFQEEVAKHNCKTYLTYNELKVNISFEPLKENKLFPGNNLHCINIRFNNTECEISRFLILKKHISASLKDNDFQKSTTSGFKSK